MDDSRSKKKPEEYKNRVFLIYLKYGRIRTFIDVTLWNLSKPPKIDSMTYLKKLFDYD